MNSYTRICIYITRRCSWKRKKNYYIFSSMIRFASMIGPPRLCTRNFRPLHAFFCVYWKQFFFSCIWYAAGPVSGYGHMFELLANLRKQKEPGHSFKTRSLEFSYSMMWTSCRAHQKKHRKMPNDQIICQLGSYCCLRVRQGGEIDCQKKEKKIDSRGRCWRNEELLNWFQWVKRVSRLIIIERRKFQTMARL